jgi:signal transduction histidine kinase
VATRRLGDVLGLRPAAAVAAVIGVAAVVALLGSLLARWPLAVAGLVLLVLGAAVALVVARVLAPVRALTDGVAGVSETLPLAAAARGTKPAADSPVTATGPDEVVALAGAVVSLQATAVALVTQEQDRHRRTGDLATHLARRNHGLVDRLVTQLGELEAAERSPIVLSQLARLKHTAVRTRRHAESMLVLTGSMPDRSRPRPSALADVLQAALAGIEDHARVATDGVDPAAVSGSVVADLAHLLAELVENGAHFSPPGTRIRISGESGRGAVGYVLRIADDGVGMTNDQLEAANARIRAAGVGSQATKLIGLDVVGRLAARHGIGVSLAHGRNGGLDVAVTLPERLLVPLTDLPAPRRPVSALVAAAAFRPPLASAPKPLPGDDSPAEPHRPRVPANVVEDEVRPGVPRRVRGAQLPDLGPERKDGPHVTPDAGRVHGRLHALQAGLSAARTDNIPPLPKPMPEPDPARATPVQAPDRDD